MAPGPAFANGQPITRPAVLDSLPAFQGDVAAWAAGEGIDPERAADLALALEEVFVNICRYAYPDGAGTATLLCGSDDRDFIIEISDNGPPFDPASLPDPDLDDDLDSRPIGGLGWFLVRQMVDDLQCHRDNGRNIVRLILHRREGSAR